MSALPLYNRMPPRTPNMGGKGGQQPQGPWMPSPPPVFGGGGKGGRAETPRMPSPPRQSPWMSSPFPPRQSPWMPGFPSPVFGGSYTQPNTPFGYGRTQDMSYRFGGRGRPSNMYDFNNPHYQAYEGYQPIQPPLNQPPLNQPPLNQPPPDQPPLNQPPYTTWSPDQPPPYDGGGGVGGKGGKGGRGPSGGQPGSLQWSLGHQVSPQEIARQQEAKAAYQASPAFAAAQALMSQPLRGSPLQQLGAGSSPFRSGNMRQAVMGQPSPRQAQSQGIVPMLASPRGGLAGYQRARQMGLHSAFRI